MVVPEIMLSVVVDSSSNTLASSSQGLRDGSGRAAASGRAAVDSR